MNDLLQTEIFLGKLSRERFDNHFEDVLDTLVLIGSVPIFFPYLGDKLSKKFSLQITYFFTDLNMFNNRFISTVLYNCMNQFSSPYIICWDFSFWKVETESCLFWQYKHMRLLFKFLYFIQWTVLKTIFLIRIV
jgi:hypothetical protein